MSRGRYERSILLPGWGEGKQERLQQARVLVIGAGGLGSAVLAYLAAAGVSAIGIVDGDRVEESNLQRQVIYGTVDLGELKCEAAARRVRDLNPEVKTLCYPDRFSAANARDLLRGCAVAIDCTDNPGTRYELNDACWELGIPWVYGAVSEYHGQVSVFIPGVTGCFRCLYGAPGEPGEHPRGVFAPLVGTIGTIQAGEVLKLLTGVGTTLAGRLLVWEALPGTASVFELAREPDCPICLER